jgi:hypothetical protein
VTQASKPSKRAKLTGDLNKSQLPLCLECKSFFNLIADQALLFGAFLAFLYLFVSFALLASGSRASKMMHNVDPLALSHFDSIFFAQMLSD